MAIDNAEKRRSVGGVPFLPLGINVTPEIAKDVEWRFQVAWNYSGIVGGGAPAPAEIPHNLFFFVTTGKLKSF